MAGVRLVIKQRAYDLSAGAFIGQPGGGAAAALDMLESLLGRRADGPNGTSVFHVTLMDRKRMAAAAQEDPEYESMLAMFGVAFQLPGSEELFAPPEAEPTVVVHLYQADEESGQRFFPAEWQVTRQCWARLAPFLYAM